MLNNVILELEHSLLTHQTRSSRQHIENTLHNDFIEFSSSGRKHSKSDALNWLIKEPPFEFEISEFNVEELATGVVLATYTIVLNKSRSLRSSLWVLNNDQWQLKFHQGTSSA